MAVAPQEILDARNDPAALERLYRGDPAGFAVALAIATANDPAADCVAGLAGPPRK